jgi:hypothetical protein
MEQQRRLNRRNLIKKHVAGLSFVDIGGLWGTTGEMVTTAHSAGASHAVMADIHQLGSPWWQKFEAHCTEHGVEGYGEKQVDICAPDAPQTLGTFDFVHCAGVMYHVADLFRFVGNLVSVTNNYLLLASVVMPNQISGASGALSFGPDQAYLTPLLTEENHRVIGEYLKETGLQPSWIDQPTQYMEGTQPRYGPWWWLFSSEFMSRLVALYGLEVLAEGPTPNGRGHSVFARVPEPSVTTST